MKKNIVFLLILIPIIWISCDGMGHQTIDFRKIENLMPQHPDSALMLLEQIENKENLSRKDKAHYYLGEFYQFNLSSCIRQQNSLTAQFVSFSLSNLANIFYPPQFLQ